MQLASWGAIAKVRGVSQEICLLIQIPLLIQKFWGRTSSVNLASSSVEIHALIKMSGDGASTGIKVLALHVVDPI